ncbi:hypothetical protein LJC52_03185 [Bacteroidales bacterium OttesenSCG-928-A17]|nr:hypothetical protein [Bacteroidales bacterium OttesenSCG-928-A17]
MMRKFLFTIFCLLPGVTALIGKPMTVSPDDKTWSREWFEETAQWDNTFEDFFVNGNTVSYNQPVLRSGWSNEWGNIPGGDPIQGPIEDCIPVVLILLGIYVLFKFRKSIRTHMKKKILTTVLLLIGLASPGWSQNPNPSPAHSEHPLMIVKPETTSREYSSFSQFSSNNLTISYTGDATNPNASTTVAGTWDINSNQIRFRTRENTIGLDYHDYRTGNSSNRQYGTAYALIYGVTATSGTTVRVLYTSSYNLDFLIKPIDPQNIPSTVTDISYEWYTARNEASKLASSIVTVTASTSYYLKASFTVDGKTTSAAAADWIEVRVGPIPPTTELADSYFVVEDAPTKRLVAVSSTDITAPQTKTENYGAFTTEPRTIDGYGTLYFVHYTPDGDVSDIGVDFYTFSDGTDIHTIYVGTFTPPGNFSSLRGDENGRYNLNSLMKKDDDGGIHSVGYQWFTSPAGGTPFDNPEAYHFSENLSHTTLYVLPVIMKRTGDGTDAVYTPVGFYMGQALSVEISVQQQFYILPNLQATSNAGATNAPTTALHTYSNYTNIEIVSQTSLYGTFSVSGLTVSYTPNGTPDKAGVDEAIVRATVEGNGTVDLKVNVVVFAAYTHSVIQNESQYKNHFLDDSMVPLDNLPKNWFVTYGYASSYNAASDNTANSWNPSGGTSDVRLFPIASLHFYSAESVAAAVAPHRTVMLIHRVSPAGRVYGANMATNRGFGFGNIELFDLDRPITGYNSTTGAPIYGAALNGNYKLTTINNYNNTSDMGTLSVSENGRKLYYVSNGDRDKVGMDIYAFAYGTESGGVVTPVTGSYRLAYTTIFKPIDKPVAKGGWVTLEMEDLSSHLPYDAVLKYEYFKVDLDNIRKAGTNDSDDPGHFEVSGEALPNDTDKKLKSTVWNVTLESALSFNSGETVSPYGPGIHYGSLGWNGVPNRPNPLPDGYSIPTTTYAVRASISQAIGQSSSTLRATTPIMPIFLWEHQLLPYITYHDYLNGLLEVKFDYAATSVCAEVGTSRLENYNTGVELVVRALAYEREPVLDANGNLKAVLNKSLQPIERKDRDGNVIFPSMNEATPVTYYDVNGSAITDTELLNVEDGSVKFLYPDNWTDEALRGTPVRTYILVNSAPVEVYRIEIETQRTGTQDDISDMMNFRGWVDSEGTISLVTSTGDNSPNHFYKVAKATFPANIANGANTGTHTNTQRSYGTRIDDNTMALYISADMPTSLFSDYTGSATELRLITATEGELLISKGICGEIEEPENLCTDGTMTTMYLQDFGGNRESDPQFLNANQIPSDAAQNVYDAIEGSTYRYKSALSSGASLPYLDEGDYFLTKVTEGHGGGWTNLHGDHTSESTTTGYMMQVNAGSEPGVFFDYNIGDLCAGAPLIFTAWVKNTLLNVNATDPIDLIFEVYEVIDGATGKLLGRYNTAPIPGPGNMSTTNWNNFNGNAWKMYGFTFQLSEETSMVRLKILNNGPGSMGNDFALDDVSVRLCTQPSLKPIPQAPEHPCEATEITVQYDVTGAIEYKYFTWLYNPTGEINEPWVVVKSGELEGIDVNPAGTATLNPSTELSAEPGHQNYVDGLEEYQDIFPSGYYRFAIGFSPTFLESSCYTAGEPIRYYSSDLGYTFLWTGAENNDWNDKDNWKFYDPTSSAKPIAATTYPTICNDVYIPYYDTNGNKIATFPVIKKNTNDLEIEGAVPTNACKDIYFLYGGMIENPQYLHYERAHVDYNFGVLEPGVTWSEDGKTVTINEGKKETLYKGVNKVAYAKDPIVRGQWHTLAAPLKKMLTGDFGLSGKPNAWQRDLETATSGDGTITGEWTETYNDPEIDLAGEGRYNSMAFFMSQWAPAYAVGIGLQDHSNLDLTLGNLRLPYYNSPSSLYYAARKLHSYNSTTEKSTFLFYDKGTHNILYGWSAEASRAPEEGYRFVFESTAGTTQNDIAYTIPVTAGEPTLLGNPMMSQLDFDRLAADNSTILTSAVYYKYEDFYNLNSQDRFTAYTAKGATDDAARYIAPLQSVVVIPGASGNLQFTVAQSTVNNDNPDFRSTNDAPADILRLEVEGKNTGKSTMTLFFREDMSSRTNAPLLRMKDSKVPSLFAIEQNTGKRNMVQYENGYARSIIPLGMLGSQEGESMQIKVSNIENMNVYELYLYDKYLSKKHNLLINDTYEYTYTNEMIDRFEIQLRAETSIDTEGMNTSNDILIYSRDKELFVSSLSIDPIQCVEVVDLLGKTIFRQSYNQSQVNIALSADDQVILVRVKTKNGEKRIKTILK